MSQLPTHCTFYQNDLKAYTDGELPPLRRFLVRRHLTHCASCREELILMTQLTEDLRATEPDAALSPSLRERLLESPPAPNNGGAIRNNSDSPIIGGRGAAFRRLPAWAFAALAIVAWFVCFPLFQKARDLTQVASAPSPIYAEKNLKVFKPIPVKPSPQATAGSTSSSDGNGAVALGASALPSPPREALRPMNSLGAPVAQNHFRDGAAFSYTPVNGDPDSLRQVHKEAGIGIQVPNPEATGDKINDMVKETGGYVAANNLSTGPDSLKSGELIVKVPEAQFETFLAAVAKLGTVQSKNVTGQDITDKTSDANQEQAVREGDLEKSEARLKALGSKAKWEDQENTRDLRIQLAQTRARLKLLKRMAALGTITVDLSQTPKNAATPVTNGFLGTLQTTTHDALQSLVGSFAALLALGIWLLAYSPIWVPLLLVGRYALKEYKKREVAV